MHAAEPIVEAIKLNHIGATCEDFVGERENFCGAVAQSALRIFNFYEGVGERGRSEFCKAIEYIEITDAIRRFIVAQGICYCPDGAGRLVYDVAEQLCIAFAEAAFAARQSAQ